MPVQTGGAEKAAAAVQVELTGAGWGGGRCSGQSEVVLSALTDRSNVGSERKVSRVRGSRVSG